MKKFSKSESLLRLNKLIKSNRLKFMYVYLADMIGLRYTIVRLDTTLSCNIRCTMCSFSDDDWYKTHANKRMDDDKISAICNQFFPEALQVHIGLGAEPTMYKNFPELVALAKNKGVPFVGMTTNAQLLKKESIEKLIDDGLDELTVSIHGANRKTYESLMKGASFEKLIENLELLKSLKAERGTSKPTLRLNFTANEENLGEMVGLIDVFGGYDIDTIQIRPIVDLGNVKFARRSIAPVITAYNAAIRVVKDQCAKRGITLLANFEDPAYVADNRSAVVYEHAVARMIHPELTWQADFDIGTMTYRAYKKASGFRLKLLKWIVFGSRDLEKPTQYASSSVAS